MNNIVSNYAISDYRDLNNYILFISARRNFSGGSEVTKGGLVRGSLRGGFGGSEPPDAGVVFKNFVKNQ